MDNANSYAIQLVKSSEADSVAQLLTGCSLPIDGLTDCLDTCFAAHDGNTIVGSVALEIYGESALLRSLAVAEASRGRGLGWALVNAALDLASDEKVSNIYILTETAPDYFGRLGFEAIDKTVVPDSVKQSVEFSSTCAETAQAMRLRLNMYHY